MTLDEALAQGFNEDTSYFAAQTLMNLILGRNMLFLHRRQNGGDTKAFEEGLKDEHRYLDNTLSKLLVTLPQHLQLVTNLQDPLAVHLNMTLNGSIISLHLATIAKLEKSIDPTMRKRSLQYCYVAAEEVMNCLRLTAHIGIDKVDNPTLLSDEQLTYRLASSFRRVCHVHGCTRFHESRRWAFHGAA